MAKHSFKKKDLTPTQKLMNGFNFSFAGACKIFMSMNRKYFIVSWLGFNLRENIVFFNKNAINHCKFETLFSAIQFFIYLVNMVTQDLTWYKPELFNDNDEFYEFANEKVYD